MKAAAGDITRALKSLDARVRAVLLYGPDEGLVRERAKLIGAQIVDHPDDPFNAVRLTSSQIDSDPARVADEMSAMSLMGGRRLVRVEGAGNKQTEAISLGINAPGDNLMIVLGGELEAKSSLRKLFEDAPNTLAIACYADAAADVAEVAREILIKAGHSLSRDALTYLTANLGNDRGVTRSELEKLALYMASEPGAEVTLAHVEDAIGDNAASAVLEIAGAVTGGEMRRLETLLERAFAAGEEPIGILRLLAKRLENLHRVASSPAQEEAVKRLRLFFKDEPVFRQQLRLWPVDRLTAAIALVADAEADCKTTGMPAQAIAARCCLRVATSVARARA